MGGRAGGGERKGGRVGVMEEGKGKKEGGREEGKRGTMLCIM